jgi:glycosyltransferase involved in cell wall biosynthesis
VLVPAYNGERFVGEALESLAAQTFGDFEAIVVDDGSTDRTGAIVAELAARDPRFRLIRQANGGTQAARNAALAASRGTWVGLLDQDDVWRPAKLASQLALAAADPSRNLLFTNYEVWDGARTLETRYERPDKVPHGDVAVRLAWSCLFQASTVMVPRAAAVAASGFDPELRNAGDWDLWLRIAEGGLNVAGTFEPLVLYRVWGGNESLDHVRTAAERILMLEKSLARKQPGDLRAACLRSLKNARAQLELAQAGRRLDDAAFVRASLRRALAAEPTPKRVLEWVASALPGAAEIIRNKLSRKFK